MKFVPGDEAKGSMKARGLTFEMILTAIADGKILAFEPHPQRPGSGRKSRAYVKTTVLLAPDVRGKLEILAKQAGSLSAAVEKAIMAQPV